MKRLFLQQKSKLFYINKMIVHDYSDNMMGYLNTVLGSYEYQHYRAEHCFVHIVQVFSKIKNILIFIEWGTFCHSIRDRFCQWQNPSHLIIPSSSIIIPSVPSQKFGPQYLKCCECLNFNVMASLYDIRHNLYMDTTHYVIPITKTIKFSSI